MVSVHGIHDWDGVTYSPSGCGWYRIIQPLAELGRHEGWETTWRAGNPPPTLTSGLLVGQRLNIAKGLPEWRRMSARLGTVYDIDDDVWNIRPVNWVAYQAFTPASRDAVASYARYAALVTVSTEPLADIMRRHNPNVRILPNMVPGWLLGHDRPRRDRVVVGWAGGSSHAEDIGMIARQVRNVLAAHEGKAELHLVGANFSKMFGCEARFTNWIPVDAGGDYYRAIDFDIALAPLTGSPFDESKSAIKALEAMALGIPVIASPVTPYRGFVRDGVTGYLAGRKEWARRLRELINDADARAEMGAAAREAARAHTMENGWRLYAAAYEDLL